MGGPPGKRADSISMFMSSSFWGTATGEFDMSLRAEAGEVKKAKRELPAGDPILGVEDALRVLEGVEVTEDVDWESGTGVLPRVNHLERGLLSEACDGVAAMVGSTGLKAGVLLSPV